MIELIGVVVFVVGGYWIVWWIKKKMVEVEY